MSRQKDVKYRKEQNMNNFNGAFDERELVNWLFLDLNSFFASCEQQLDPRLRGRPVAVVPGMMDTTCCIAASYEAKAFGVKTGTLVREAKRLCPELVLLEGQHRKYIEFHHAVKAAFETCLPVEEVMSIDEFAGRLTGRQREPERAVALAHQVKAAINRDVGEFLGSSIGIAPNRFLAKVASDMEKPHGLTLVRHADLPHCLHRLKLRDLCGISHGMEQRLHRVGITTLPELTAAPPYLMKAAWGGIEGLRYYAYLRGEDLVRPPTQTRALSHQHVLEPQLRTPARAYQYLKYLLSKAAQRLREKGFYARQLVVQVKFMNSRYDTAPDERRGDWGLAFTETQSTQQLLKRLEEIWAHVPQDQKPLRIGVVLCNLIPASAHQFDLFQAPAPAQTREIQLLAALDELNNRYGTGTIGYGVVRRMFAGPGQSVKGYEGKIAFQRIPSLDEFERTHQRRYGKPAFGPSFANNEMGSMRYWKPGQDAPGGITYVPNSKAQSKDDFNSLRHRI